VKPSDAHHNDSKHRRSKPRAVWVFAMWVRSEGQQLETLLKTDRTCGLKGSSSRRDVPASRTRSLNTTRKCGFTILQLITIQGPWHSVCRKIERLRGSPETAVVLQLIRALGKKVSPRAELALLCDAYRSSIPIPSSLLEVCQEVGIYLSTYHSVNVRVPKNYLGSRGMT